jgi:hypothetical protein
LGYNPSDEVRHQGQSQSIAGGLGEIVINSLGQFKSSNQRLQGLGRKFTARCDMHLQEAPDALDQDGKLNAYFVEYMMGLPKGWVTETGLSRAQQLKMLGNGVVPQQAELALELLLNYDTPSEQDLCK